jgi:glutaredoxin-like YruB-family protein
MSTAFKRIALILLLISGTTVWAGSMYKWVDSDGVAHYSDGAPDESKHEGRVETRPATRNDAATTPPQTPEPSGTQSRSAPEARPTAKVEIYSASWCGYCQQTKNYFRRRGIPFTEYDVETDRQAAQRLRKYNPRGGIPVTVIDGKPIIGYAPKAFAAALGLP